MAEAAVTAADLAAAVALGSPDVAVDSAAAARARLPRAQTPLQRHEMCEAEQQLPGTVAVMAAAAASAPAVEVRQNDAFRHPLAQRL